MLAVWVVAVLGAIAAAIVSATRGSESLAINLKAEAQARRAAESGAVMGVAGVEQLLESAHDSATRRTLLNSLETQSARAEEEVLGDERFAFTYVDVNSRLDINWATEQQLTRLFEFFSSPAEATASAAAIHNRVAGGDVGNGVPGQRQSHTDPLRSLGRLDACLVWALISSLKRPPFSPSTVTAESTLRQRVTPSSPLLPAMLSMNRREFFSSPAAGRTATS